ncbi:hypothetical protein AGMMS4952_26630 [Spirochaetia bacterium]|nr:hypothetical protein AGMMS4952_26630 [Spirochaetia bacterium]
MFSTNVELVDSFENNFNGYYDTNGKKAGVNTSFPRQDPVLMKNVFRYW